MKTLRCYAGIGSRSTPPEILEIMTSVASCLEKEGWTLRSGGASGADSAFEKGAKSLKEVYLPWQGFNNKYQSTSAEETYLVASKLSGWVESLESVQKYHPAPECLSEAAIFLMARNAMQVLGSDMKSPSEFILCWTPDGRDIGGTSQAIRIAKSHGIPIHNMGKAQCVRKIRRFLDYGEKFYED